MAGSESAGYLTFVAIDSQGRRMPVPPLDLQSDEEKRRFEDAGRRREIRESEARRRHESRAESVRI